MGDKVVTGDSQLNETPAAHECRKEGRERPTPIQDNAIRSFYPTQVKAFVQTAEAATEFVESYDDSTARRTGVGQTTTKQMRHTTDESERTEDESRAARGEVKKLTWRNFSPSQGPRVSHPHRPNRSGGRKWRVRTNKTGVRAVADTTYYYCNLTPCYVSVVETGRFLTACYPRLSGVVA